jgi:predicted site-specific integrase-resolvase
MSNNPIITEIPATIDMKTFRPLDSAVKLRVAAYARVSTNQEEQLSSYKAQVEYYTEYIQANPNWIFVKVYTEANIFLRTIFSLARLIGQTAHKAPVYADFLNPVPA